ncbi:hypothetical protein CLV42_11488 [Chitinophaga ginsengisoli]|uniref:Uncharacterized protein n=1 Tax=Chitinophaga ginsengisoli TaxID=363837 RepID=A0A2P8FT97_9BACT|nr:hypothetical protein CLV42_11488 [Chitinophaga ginsengisoli]
MPDYDVRIVIPGIAPGGLIYCPGVITPRYKQWAPYGVHRHFVCLPQDYHSALQTMDSYSVHRCFVSRFQKVFSRISGIKKGER